jgi:hypothetical protein
VEVFLESLARRPADPMAYQVQDSAGTVLLTGETTILED